MMMRVSVTSLLLIVSIYYSAAWTHVQRQGFGKRQSTCGGSQVACGPGASRQCIPQTWVCDGDNDCGDNSDEEAGMCAMHVCPDGYVSCDGPLPSRRCIHQRWLCDGDNDCGNNWDEQSSTCANRECPGGRRRCPGNNRCIPQSYFCDGDNDCGDMSDETDCPPITCRPGSVPCPGGRRRCISERWLCDGDNDCGDNSDENPEACQNNPVVTARQCLHTIYTVCVTPVAMVYRGMDPEEITFKINTTSLRETCRPVLTAQQCAHGVLSSPTCHITDTDHPSIVELGKMVQMVDTTVTFVCRDNVDVFDVHKQCLLRTSTYGRAPDIAQAIRRQCRNAVNSYCPPPSASDCAENAVRQQCGQEIAGKLRELDTKLREIGCRGTSENEDMKKKELYSGKKEKHSGFELMKKQMYSEKKQKHSEFEKKGKKENHSGYKMMKKEMYSPLKLWSEAFRSLF